MIVILVISVLNLLSMLFSLGFGSTDRHEERRLKLYLVLAAVMFILSTLLTVSKHFGWA